MNDDNVRRSGRTNRKFKPEEDEKLRSLVRKYGDMAWNEIAKEMEYRNVRQCHDRWYYYLNPQLNNTPWTKEEDKRLIKLAKEYKGKWVAISKHFNRRTDTQIKNRWNILKKTMKLPYVPRRRRQNRTNIKFNVPQKENNEITQKSYVKKELPIDLTSLANVSQGKYLSSPAPVPNCNEQNELTQQSNKEALPEESNKVYIKLINFFDSLDPFSTEDYLNW